MAIKKAVREELQGKFNGLSKRRIDQIIKKTQEKYRIVDRDIAGYVLAFENKINLKKHLEPELINKVQKAMQSISIGPSPRTDNRNKKQSDISPILKIGNNFEMENSVLSKKLINEASKMAEVYPFIYVFENSVRNFIMKVMESSYGKEWWTSNKISGKTKRKVTDRLEKESKNKWHGKRGAHPIFYTDIDDLANIITNNWKDFENYFPSQSWITAKIEIIETSRNVVSHNNPLSPDDIASVKLNFKQWTKQVKEFNFDT